MGRPFIKFTVLMFTLLGFCTGSKRFRKGFRGLAFGYAESGQEALGHLFRLLGFRVEGR